MKISRVIFLVAGTLVLFCVSAGGFLLYKEQGYAKESSTQQALIEAQKAQLLAQHQAEILKENTRPFSDRAMNDAVPKVYTRPVSEWKANEKSIYQKLLSGGRFDVLVVPFQVQEYALGRPTRSLMTAELALAIAAAQKSRVADPYLVARALGDGERRLDPNEVYGLADKINAKIVVWGYVGHNRKNQMAISIQAQERGAHGILNAQSASTSKNIEPIAFSDERPPIEVYQSMIPKVLKAIGVDGSAIASSKSESIFEAAELPTAPLAMVVENQNPARDALYFLLLAYLTPDATERTKERFAEKSYLAILNMSQDSPDYRALKARALMLLGLRPAALQVLGEAKTIEEKELLAMLNGNQPDVDLYSSQIKPSIKRLIARLDANYLARKYAQIDKGTSLASVASLKLPGKLWPIFAARAFSDLDLWAQFDNIYVKQLLDQEFPIKDYTAEGMVLGAASLGDSEKLQTLANLSVLNHTRKLFEIDPVKWCCQSTIDRPSAMDYLNLIEAVGEDNLIRRADFLTQIQGAPEQSLEFLNRIENLYKGHPKFTLARSEAQNKKAKTIDGTEKEGLQKLAYTNAFDAWYWEQGQTEISSAAFDLIGDIGRQDYGYFDNFYASDYPYRPFYSDWEHGGHPEYAEANAEAALKNSTANLRPFNSLNWHYTDFMRRDDKYDALMKSIDGRFAGNPTIYQLQAKNSLAKGDVQLAEQYYRVSIKAQPKAWQAYRDLGILLFEQGQLEKAAKLFMEYPGFNKNSKDNPVGISNNAYEAGSKFYWLGDFSVAKPLYEIASRKETGSDADITSRLRLNLLAGHYREALLGSLERARHYNDTYALRDYLGMLHAMNASKVAWDTFNVLSRQMDDPHIWESVLVGHRKEGKSESEIAAWVKQQVDQNVGKNSNRAAKYFLRAGVADRMPTMRFVSALVEVAQPAWKVSYEAGPIVEPSENGRMQSVLGPQSNETSTLPIGVFDSANKSRVKSNLVYFAEAYQAIRMENFASAKTILQEASTLYDLSLTDLGYILPYYAFAAAKTEDVSGIEKYLADFSPKKKGYDYFLAQAIISGVRGKIEESIQSLKTALYKRPFTENRPLQTEYQYAEICKWLYEATGNLQYKAITLDWAQKNQKFQPWFSWAYAMEAVLSDNKAERKRAIAMAFYLDPHSEMLGQIPQKERDIAVKEFKGKNPFLKKDNADVQEAI